MDTRTPRRLEIAFADHRDNRMIILGGAAWDTLAEQERHFDALPAVEVSDFIVDFYDDDGSIDRDKCVSQATVETALGAPIAELIERGRRREDALSAQVRSTLGARP